MLDSDCGRIHGPARFQFSRGSLRPAPCCRDVAADIARSSRVRERAAMQIERDEVKFQAAYGGCHVGSPSR